jgi:hypothetical protein
MGLSEKTEGEIENEMGWVKGEPNNAIIHLLQLYSEAKGMKFCGWNFDFTGEEEDKIIYFTKPINDGYSTETRRT